jgi:hypothetical protein
MKTPSRCPECEREYISYKRWYTGNAKLAPFRCTPCNQIAAKNQLREQNREEQLALESMDDSFEKECVMGCDDEFSADGSLTDYA